MIVMIRNIDSARAGRAVFMRFWHWTVLLLLKSLLIQSKIRGTEDSDMKGLESTRRRLRNCTKALEQRSESSEGVILDLERPWIANRNFFDGLILCCLILYRFILCIGERALLFREAQASRDYSGQL